MRRGTAIVRAALVCLILAGVMVWPATGVAAGSAYYVGTLADDDGTNTANCAIQTNTDCTLRSAIAAASSGSDWIMFRDGLSGTITLTHGPLPILDTLAIYGPGADVLTVSGNHASRVFYVDMPDSGTSSADGMAVEIRGLTIADGLAGSGGGVYLAPGFYHKQAFTLTIRECTFSGNRAIDQGGGLYVSNAYLREDRQYSPIMVNVLNSTFVNNDADERGGGAIQNGSDGTDAPILLYDRQNTTQLTITNSTFVGNSAGWTGTGGAIRNWSRLAVINSTLTQNSSAGSVGGIDSIIGPTSITNTIVSGNFNNDIAGNVQGDNNLVGTTGIWPVPGNNNQIGVSVLLGTLGNYGGTTQTVPLVPGSQAIDAGVNGGTIPMYDQRGVERIDQVDIGAFQSRGFTIAMVSGDQQSTAASSNFPEPFVVSVVSAFGDPVAGGIVTFTGPETGAGIQGSPVQTAIGADGQTHQTLKANNVAGTYTVQASTAGVGTVTYSLENTDTAPPTTTARATKADRSTYIYYGWTDEYVFGTWTNQPVTVHLEANDHETTVAQAMYTIDGGDPQIYQTPVTISSDGSHTFTFWSTDAVGNVEASQSVIINIDASIVLPDTEILDHPPAVTSTRRATFAFSGVVGSFPIERLACRLFNSDFEVDNWFENCTSPWDLGLMPDGTWTLQMWAIDTEKQADMTPASFTWTVEGALPETTFLTTPPAQSSSSSASFTFAINDNVELSTFQCALDSAPFHYCSSPLEITGLSDGSHTLQVRAIDKVGTYELTPASYTWNVSLSAVPAITSAASTTFTVGTAGSFTVTTTGDPTPTLSLTGSLPAGVSFDSASGLLSGTPAVGIGGVYPLTITASNGEAAVATQAFTLTVNEAAFITSEAATTFTVGVAGSFQVTATGFPVASFSVAGGGLPAGISLASDGLLSGTPESGSGGVYSVTVMASNGVGFSPLQLVTVTVGEAPTFTSAETTIFITGQPGGFTVTANGYPQATFSSAGTLPAGVTLTSGGTLSGTPSETAAGSYPITITATNGLMPDATQSFTLNVYEPVKFTSLDTTTFTAGTEGSYLVTASGMPIIAFSTTGLLPAGVSLGSNGVLSGTPAAGTGGIHTFEIVASNGVQPDATQMFSLTINEASAFTSDAATTFEVGQPGSFTVAASGDPAPTFSLEGTLPDGVTFGSDGMLSGTPVDGGGGVYQVTLVAANGIDPDAVQTFTLTVNEAPVITSADAATFELNILGSVTVTADGYPQATFSTSGPLPGGVTLGADGLLSGSATEGGTFEFTVVASNGVEPDASQTFTLTVVVPEVIAPDDITVSNDPDQAGAVVTYPPATSIGTVGEITCTPGSGSVFPIGETTVTCTSETGLEDTFTITVLDSQPPTLTVPANITVENTPGQEGAVVTYPDPVAQDNAPGVTVACDPPSGTFFPIATTTTITCTATDTAGNQTTAEFTVTVEPSTQYLLDALRADTITLVTNQATERVLLETLDRVQQYVNAGNPHMAYMTMLQYVVQVDAQLNAKRITPAAAGQLLAQAQLLVRSLV